MSKDDFGFYTCQATNAAGKTEVVIQVSIVTPPEIREPEKQEAIAVEALKSVALNCPIISSPMPKVRKFCFFLLVYVLIKKISR